MSDVTDAQREIAGIVAEFHRKIRMRTGMVDAIVKIVVSDDLALALGITRDGAIIGDVVVASGKPSIKKRRAALGMGPGERSLDDLDDVMDAVGADPSPGVRAAAAEALEDATPAVAWVDHGPTLATADCGPLSLTASNVYGTQITWVVSVEFGSTGRMRGTWRDVLIGTADTLDDAKAAAIAAARAWRDSIRL